MYCVQDQNELAGGPLPSHSLMEMDNPTDSGNREKPAGNPHPKRGQIKVKIFKEFTSFFSSTSSSVDTQRGAGDAGDRESPASTTPGSR
ncbi:hypothetical protein Cni_G13094 [Canna indica]|uniref:Uncharacterized protein n=1 Tax=Canna indica TaxID=4628 RepID=A0AAQ3KBX5_9LILI|nr:hypothetical protein Cni_G13094 [Canna indica]